MAAGDPVPGLIPADDDVEGLSAARWVWSALFDSGAPVTEPEWRDWADARILAMAGDPPAWLCELALATTIQTAQAAVDTDIGMDSRPPFDVRALLIGFILERSREIGRDACWKLLQAKTDIAEFLDSGAWRAYLSLQDDEPPHHEDAWRWARSRLRSVDRFAHREAQRIKSPTGRKRMRLRLERFGEVFFYSLDNPPKPDGYLGWVRPGGYVGDLTYARIADLGEGTHLVDVKENANLPKCPEPVRTEDERLIEAAAFGLFMERIGSTHYGPVSAILRQFTSSTAAAIDALLTDEQRVAVSEYARTIPLYRWERRESYAGWSERDDGHCPDRSLVAMRSYYGPRERPLK
jgi:hypothetical protein